MPEHAHGKTIAEALKDAIDIGEHKGKPPYAMAIGILKDITDGACVVLGALDDPASKTDELVAAAEYFYDEYFVPIDLPINSLAERFIERQLRGWIGPAIENAVQHIAG